jgi:hypothetical protein
MRAGRTAGGKVNSGTTCGHACRHDLTTVEKRWPHGPCAKPSNAAWATSTGSGADRAQRGRQRLAFFPIGELETVEDEVHDARLQRGGRIDHLIGRHRPVVSQHRFAAGVIALIGDAEWYHRADSRDSD